MSNEDNNESFISHLEALRSTILKCLYSVAIVLPFTFFISPKALNWLLDIILRDNKVTLNYFSPVEVFLIQIKIAILIDLIICFPYIAKQIWNFILPALYEHEKKFIKSIVLFSSLLFISGVLFCIFFILPLIINFGLSFTTENIQAVLNISNIVMFSLWLSIAFGIMFQVPIITMALIKSDFISYETIARKRPYIIVVLLIISGILTPPDVISQLMLAIPTYLLFEAGLLFSKTGKKQLISSEENENTNISID